MQLKIPNSQSDSYEVSLQVLSSVLLCHFQSGKVCCRLQLRKRTTSRKLGRETQREGIAIQSLDFRFQLLNSRKSSFLAFWEIKYRFPRKSPALKSAIIQESRFKVALFKFCTSNLSADYESSVHIGDYFGIGFKFHTTLRLLLEPVYSENFISRQLHHSSNNRRTLNLGPLSPFVVVFTEYKYYLLLKISCSSA